MRAFTDKYWIFLAEGFGMCVKLDKNHTGLPMTKLPRHNGESNHKTVPELSKDWACPSDWIIQDHSIGNQLHDCGPLCNIFSELQKYMAAIVNGIVAASTIFSSLFTIVTAVLDSRFHYPERAIVHLAVCYAILAISYLVGAIWGAEISCGDGFIVYGHGAASCTLLFMFTYFFTYASHIWWLLFALTCYLSLGLKWGGQAIATYSLHFHLTAWGVSAFPKTATVALGYVEGNPLAGPCTLRIQRSPTIPLFLLLLIGTMFFFLGFLALFQMWQEIKRLLCYLCCRQNIYRWSKVAAVGSAGKHEQRGSS